MVNACSLYPSAMECPLVVFHKANDGDHSVCEGNHKSPEGGQDFIEDASILRSEMRGVSIR
jgi:hypothetical protein